MFKSRALELSKVPGGTGLSRSIFDFQIPGGTGGTKLRGAGQMMAHLFFEGVCSVVPDKDFLEVPGLTEYPMKMSLPEMVYSQLIIAQEHKTYTGQLAGANYNRSRVPNKK